MKKHANTPIPAHVQDLLNEVHQVLLTLHKELLDHQRMLYERQHGAIHSTGEALQLIIKDPWFASLRPLTALITDLDEIVASKAPNYPADTNALLTQCKQLLKPAETGDLFQREFHRAIQESPGVAAAHGQWKSLLRRLDPKQ